MARNASNISTDGVKKRRENVHYCPIYAVSDVFTTSEEVQKAPSFMLKNSMFSQDDFNYSENGGKLLEYFQNI